MCLFKTDDTVYFIIFAMDIILELTRGITIKMLLMVVLNGNIQLRNQKVLLHHL